MKSDCQRVIFIDGVCILCNWLADFIIRLDHKQKFKWATLQSETAKAMMGKSGSTPDGAFVDLDSVIYLREGREWHRSRALLWVAWDLGSVWRIPAGFGFLIPVVIADRIYDWVAKNRYKWFGRREQCRLPHPSDHDRFLT